ncbi:MAG: hypothetical protein CVU52_04345, partial [Deltaproteobacteria bacterium HGW-Deltaproteobacteria-10]
MITANNFISCPVTGFIGLLFNLLILTFSQDNNAKTNVDGGCHRTKDILHLTFCYLPLKYPYSIIYNTLTDAIGKDLEVWKMKRILLFLATNIAVL